jgi:hypothetical protein
MKICSVVLELLQTDVLKLMGIFLHFLVCMCQEMVYIMKTAPTNITTVFGKEVHYVLVILSCLSH